MVTAKKTATKAVKAPAKVAPVKRATHKVAEPPAPVVAKKR